MKLKKILSLLLVLALFFAFVPKYASTIYAEEQTVEEMTETETVEEDVSDSDIIIEDSFVAPGDNSVELNSFGDSVLYDCVTDLGADAVIPEGIYAFENIGNVNYWMDVYGGYTDAGALVIQTKSNTHPIDTFDRSCLFKVSRVESTNSYIFRSMLNNRLILVYEDGSFKTKEVSPNDEDIISSYTFTVTAVGSGYCIHPYGFGKVIAAPNSTVSGTTSAALLGLTSTLSGDRGKWLLYRYTGADKSGISIPISPTNWNLGAKVGITYNLKLKTWSTVIGANTPYLTVHPDYTDMATYSWNASNYTLTVTPLKEGPIGIRSIIRKDGTTTAQHTYKSVYTVVPEIDGDTAFVQNAGTGKYIDLESASLVEEGIIQQAFFHAGTYSQWEFEAVYGGFFKIKSVHSGMYIGVDSTDTTKVKQYANSNNYTLWRLKKTSSGSFALYCRATESSSLVLSVPSLTSGDCEDLTMLTYVDDTNYIDEWKIVVFPLDVALIAVPESYNRSSFFDNVISQLNGIGYINCYNNHLTTPNNMGVTKTELLQYMANSKITLIRTHGGRTGISVLGGHLLTSDLAALGSDYLSYSDIIIYGACSTAMGGSTDNGNLVNATVAAGARTAIGFENSVERGACNKWCEFFFEYYTEYYYIDGKTLYDVCIDTDIRAKAECATYEYTNANGDLVTLKNYVIVGDASIPN